jgi:hypothetical protein
MRQVSVTVCAFACERLQGRVEDRLRRWAAGGA